MIHEERITHNPAEGPSRRGDYLLYWMQQSQRSRMNHALELAIRQANRREIPLVIAFVLFPFPEAGIRPYRFLLEGLKEADRNLRSRNLSINVFTGHPAEVLRRPAEKAAAVVFDRGYLRIQRQLRQELRRRLTCPVIEVESDALVPVETAYAKEAYSAGILRRPYLKMREGFLTPLRETTPLIDSSRYRLPGAVTPEDPALLEGLEKLGAEAGTISGPAAAGPVPAGGEDRARNRLCQFIEGGLQDYTAGQSPPERQGTSGLSAYLHFGQISPLEIALEVRERADRGEVSEPNAEAFLEQLLVRRELAQNFVWYNLNYDQYDALPDWCRRTLEIHGSDPRPAVYTEKEMEEARTEDPYWNAAQDEMRYSGFMHNTMRMYWGKKILEWTPDPREAFSRALRLNNRYLLDGRDPNGYAGVAWCFGKHDRPWQERPVFGKVRYMNAKGLERKYDIKAYLARIEALRAAAGISR